MSDLFWVGCLGALLTGLGKGGLPGAGNLTVILFAYVFGGKESVGILLPVLMSADVVAVCVYKHHASWVHIRKMMPWMLAGIVIGFILMNHLENLEVKKLIGSIILFMAAIHIFRKQVFPCLGLDMNRMPQHWSFQSFTGILGGFSTMVANAAGPVAQLYLASIELPKMAFIGTAAWFFLIINWIKVPLFIYLDLINLSSLSLSIRFMAFAMLGAYLAPRLVLYINQQLFDFLIWSFVILAGFKLILS